MTLSTKSWGNGSVGKSSYWARRRSKLNTQHTNKNPGVAACICHPSTVEAEKWKLFGPAGQDHADQGEFHL